MPYKVMFTVTQRLAVYSCGIRIHQSMWQDTESRLEQDNLSENKKVTSLESSMTRSCPLCMSV